MLLVTLLSLLAAAPPGDGPEDAVVAVDGSRVTGRVDPRFFGLFTEHIGDALDWRLPAEKLRGRGFESGDADADGVVDPWWPVGEATFAIDADTSYPRFPDGRSSHSQRIDLGAGPAGIRQSGLAVERGDALTVRLHARATGGATRLRLRLLIGPDDEVLAEALLEDLPHEWGRLTASLEPTRDAFPCSLEVLAEGEGSLWLDQFSALPDSQVGGWRKAVVDLYGWLRPATLRYPGGNFCQTYHFADGIGPVDLRPVVPNPAWGNYPEPNHIGTDEFLGLCERVGMEPILCLNIGDTGGRSTLPDNSSERALRESLEWLEYVNGDASTEWGAKRAANGHPTPYGTRLWEVGNEIGYGHIHGQLTKEQYAARFVEFARALRATDPTIELIACGFDPDWNRLLMREGRDLADYVAIHVYDNVPMPGDTAAHPPLYIGPWLDSHIQALKDGGVAPGTVRLALNEWSYSWSYWGGPDRAVAAAGLLHECLRRADWVAMTNNSDAVARFRNNETTVFPDSECLAMALLAQHTGREVLGTSVAGPTFETLERGAAVPGVDAVASRDGEKLLVSLINRCARTVRTALSLSGLGHAPTGVAAWGVRSTVPGGRTTFEMPAGLATMDLPAPPDGPVSEVELPPMSVTVLEFRCSTGDGPPKEPVSGLVSAGDGPLAGAAVTLLPAGAGEPLTTVTNEEGRFVLAAPAGAYRLCASARGYRESTPRAIAVPGSARAGIELRLEPVAGSEGYEALTGAFDAARWTTVAWEGAEGSVSAGAEGVSVTSPPESRYGLLSAPLEVGADEALVIEAHVASFTGMNALMHLTAEGREGQFQEFAEVGVERGRAVAWVPGIPSAGPRASAPPTLRAVIGPRMPSGRTVELSVNGEVVQRACDLGWLADRSPRVLLYGYGEGVRTWDWVHVQRVSVPRRLVFADDFDTLDPTRWHGAVVAGTAGALEVRDGALTIQGAPESRFGALTEPLPQGPAEALVVSARLRSLEGLNGILCLLGGGEGDYTGVSEAAVENGLAQAWIGDWSRATERVAPPADLRIVAGPARGDGTRRMRVYVNDRLVSMAPALPGQERPLRLFLYGWSTAKTAWDRVRVEMIDTRALGEEMLAPSAAVG
jgi:alpha-L-arabinofuranosidase